MQQQRLAVLHDVGAHLGTGRATRLRSSSNVQGWEEQEAPKRVRRERDVEQSGAVFLSHLLHGHLHFLPLVCGVSRGSDLRLLQQPLSFAAHQAAKQRQTEALMKKKK